jgi:hypothetical protein
LARAWAVELVAERVRARMRWLEKGGVDWRWVERVETTVRPVLPVAPMIRKEEAIVWESEVR